MLSFEEDNYTISFMEGYGRWVVVLNNGQKVYQDDERPYVNPTSAWLRLKIYCEQQKLHIQDMYLQFRSHYEAIKSNADGYFFRKRAMSGFNRAKTDHFYVIGTLENDIVRVDSWKLPELIVTESEVRDIKDCESSLIRRTK